MEIKDERTSGEGQGRGGERRDREKLDTLYCGSNVDWVNSSARLQRMRTTVTVELRNFGKNKDKTN